MKKALAILASSPRLVPPRSLRRRRRAVSAPAWRSVWPRARSRPAPPVLMVRITEPGYGYYGPRYYGPAYYAVPDRTPIMAGRITGIATIAIGNLKAGNQKARSNRSGLFAGTNSLQFQNEGRLNPLHALPSVRGVIFLALAFEFLLGCLEARNACRNFCPLARQPFFLFGHRPSRFLLIRIPQSLAVREWGANWETALRDCDRARWHSEGGG